MSQADARPKMTHGSQAPVVASAADHGGARETAPRGPEATSEISAVQPRGGETGCARHMKMLARLKPQISLPKHYRRLRSRRWSASSVSLRERSDQVGGPC